MPPPPSHAPASLPNRSTSVPPVNNVSQIKVPAHFATAGDDEGAPSLVLSSSFLVEALDSLDHKDDAKKMLSIISTLKSRFIDDPRPSTSSLSLLSSFMETINSKCISRLGTAKFASFVKTLLSVKWTCYSDEGSAVVKRYSDWLLNVLSAHPIYVTPALESLVNILGEDPDDNGACRVHHVLRLLLKMIPSLPSSLLPVLNEGFPHARGAHSNDVLCSFVRACLEIATYWPPLRGSITDLIMSKIIQIDVEIQVEVDELEESALEDLEAAVIQDHGEDQQEGALQDEDLRDDCEADSDEEFLSAHACDSVQLIRHLVDRLDSSMALVFQFIDDIKEKEGPKALSSLFLSFLMAFERTILPTLKSKYAQFILFYMTSLDERYPDYFLGILVARLTSPAGYSHSSWLDSVKIGPHEKNLTKPSATSFDGSSALSLGGFDAVRLTAVAYIGSYVSRARFLSASVVRRAMDRLLTWCLAYLGSNGCSKCKSGEYCSVSNFSLESAHSGYFSSRPKTSGLAFRHAVFYSVSQAIFYMFCFRHQECLDGTGDETAADSRTIKSLLSVLSVNSCLHPLSSTLSSISSEFCRIVKEKYADMYDSAYRSPHPLITPDSSRTPSPFTKAPSSSATMTLNNSGGILDDPAALNAQLKALEEIDNFFPFDPFKLSKCKLFVSSSSLYTEWPSSSADDDGVSDEN